MQSLHGHDLFLRRSDIYAAERGGAHQGTEGLICVTIVLYPREADAEIMAERERNVISATRAKGQW
jgi:hypothetical protein